jgi:uncharacterized protein YjdB
MNRLHCQSHRILRPEFTCRGTSSGLTYFPGLIDDVRIYATALTATQVQQLAATTPQNSTISPASGTFDLNPNGTDHASIPVTVTPNGNTLTSITNGSYTLKQGTDYTVSGNVYTIQTSYLDTLAVGTADMTFNFSAGNPATLAVTVENTTPQNSGINPISATFDLNPNGTDHASIPVTVTWNGNTLTSITNGSYTLKQGTDYTVSGNVYTIQTNYLDTLAAGPVDLTFNFSAGVPATLAVTVENTTPSSSSGISFDPVSGSAITGSTPITITASPALSTAEAVYWNTTGFPVNTGDHLYQDTGLTLSTSGAVYAAVYNPSTGSWFDQASATYTVGVIVPVTGVSLDKTSYTIGISGKDTLTATISPSDATNGNVIWSSDTPSVATVAGNGPIGTVTGVATGTAHITVTTVNGGFSETCAVTVITPPLVSTSGSGTVSNVTGGIVKQGSAASVTIPASALGSAGATVTVESVPSPLPAPTGDTVIGAYEFTVNGGGYGFSTPVTLTFTFPAGITNPAVYYYDTSTSQWVLVTGGTVNGDTITVTVDHFTTFAVIAQATTNNTVGGGGGSSIGGGGGGSTPALSITTTSLSAGTVDQFYSQTISTNEDGTAPYTFSVISGTLPPGLAMDSSTGVISGTPTTAGTYTFTVTVRDADGNLANESYTLTVDAATTVQPLASPTPSPSIHPVTLTDIAGNWAYASIEKLVSMGAITGYPDGTFRPNNDITRAEFVTVLIKALKLPPESGPVFADTENSWAKTYISTAAAYGIVSGYDASHFGPNDLVTREQMTAMVVRAAKLAPVSGELTFKDAALIDPWARGYVVPAVKDGIVNGYPDDTFRPLAYATRAGAATVIAGIAK